MPPVDVLVRRLLVALLVGTGSLPLLLLGLGLAVMGAGAPGAAVLVGVLLLAGLAVAWGSQVGRVPSSGDLLRGLGTALLGSALTAGAAWLWQASGGRWGPEPWLWALASGAVWALAVLLLLPRVRVVAAGLALLAAVAVPVVLADDGLPRCRPDTPAEVDCSAR